MFFEGDLQSGIALAIQDSKLVACFIRGETSITVWQGHFADHLGESKMTGKQAHYGRIHISRTRE
jgi:hypothetical protein